MPDNLLKSALLAEIEYWGSAGAGAIFFSKNTGKFLIGLRSASVDQPGEWGSFGGKLDYDEGPEDAVQREIEEETGYNGPLQLVPLAKYKDGDFTFHNYVAIVEDEFRPKLSWETDDCIWTTLDKLPRPLHFGMKYMLKHSGDTLQKLAQNSVEEAMDTPPPPIIRRAEMPSTSAATVMTPESITNAYVVVATLWKEARGDGYEGMQAVMNVIMNRSKGNFTNAFKVATRPYQFAVWNGISDPKQHATLLVNKYRRKELADHKQFEQAIQIVDLAMKGKLKDITGGATFYFEPTKVNPSWAAKLKFLKQIGHHVFYGVKPKTASPKRKTVTKKKSIKEEKEAITLDNAGKLEFKHETHSTRDTVLHSIRIYNKDELVHSVGVIGLLFDTPYEDLGSLPPKPGYVFVDFIQVEKEGAGYGYLLYREALRYVKSIGKLGLSSSNRHRTDDAARIWSKLKTSSDYYYDYLNVKDLGTKLKEVYG